MTPLTIKKILFNSGLCLTITGTITYLISFMTPIVTSIGIVYGAATIMVAALILLIISSLMSNKEK